MTDMKNSNARVVTKKSMIDFKQLEDLLVLLNKHGVEEFEGEGFKFKLKAVFKETSKLPDLSNTPKKTPEQLAEEELYWSTRG